MREWLDSANEFVDRYGPNLTLAALLMSLLVTLLSLSLVPISERAKPEQAMQITCREVGKQLECQHTKALKVGIVCEAVGVVLDCRMVEAKQP